MATLKDLDRAMVAPAWPVVDNFLPDFELPSSEGQLIHISDYHGRRSLVLVFAGEHYADASNALLRDLARHYNELIGETAEVLAVVRASPAEASRIKERCTLPFPVLADGSGQVHRRYGAMTRDGGSAAEAVYVAGRFGKVYLSSRATDGPPLPTTHDILGALRFIQAECPECGRDEPFI